MYDSGLVTVSTFVSLSQVASLHRVLVVHLDEIPPVIRDVEPVPHLQALEEF